MTPEQRPTRAARHRGSRHLGRYALVAALSFTLLLGLLAGGLAYYEYSRLNGQIRHVDALQTTDPNIQKPALQLHAANYLVIGSDSRAGANSTSHTVTGARSDTTILIHLSENHEHVTVISIPRDSWIRIPTCRTVNNDFARKGTVLAAHDDQFNSAFAIGGARCTIAAIQEITGIRVSHYLQVDFSGFRKVVDALHGVTICSPTVVDDPLSQLRLKVGENRLDGAQALHYVRARETITGGSDLARIKRQQQFLGVVLRQALSGSLLSNPIRLDDFLDALTRAIVTDKHTSIGDLRTLGRSMSGLDPKRVVFYTAPIKDPDYSPPGTSLSGKVLLDPVEGRTLYDSVIDDTAGSTKASSAAPHRSTSPAPDLNAGEKTCSL